jgi:putative sterol carrier protein
LRLQIAGKTVRVLVVHDGHLELTGDDGSVDATLVCASREDVIAILRGEVNPIVASLRNRVRLIGDRSFGAKVVMGLRSGSPFARLPIERSPYVVGDDAAGKGA